MKKVILCSSLVALLLGGTCSDVMATDAVQPILANETLKKGRITNVGKLRNYKSELINRGFNPLDGSIFDIARECAVLYKNIRDAGTEVVIGQGTWSYYLATLLIKQSEEPKLTLTQEECEVIKAFLESFTDRKKLEGQTTEQAAELVLQGIYSFGQEIQDDVKASWIAPDMVSLCIVAITEKLGKEKAAPIVGYLNDASGEILLPETLVPEQQQLLKQLRDAPTEGILTRLLGTFETAPEKGVDQGQLKDLQAKLSAAEKGKNVLEEQLNEATGKQRTAEEGLAAANVIIEEKDKQIKELTGQLVAAQDAEKKEKPKKGQPGNARTSGVDEEFEREEDPVDEGTTTDALISAGVKAWNAIPMEKRDVRDQRDWEDCCKEVADEAENNPEEYVKLMQQYYGIGITVEKKEQIEQLEKKVSEEDDDDDGGDQASGVDKGPEREEDPVDEGTTTEALISAGVKAWNAIPMEKRDVRDQRDWEDCCKEVADEAGNDQKKYKELMKQYYGIEITVQK
ncbi:MAG: hypothetical protein K6C34_01130 [Alphaproteobacteria bacterium]|nr:hypothetical protein [Alphaproteobacteria bacterium]